MQPWQPVQALSDRVVAVIGAGVLGRRIGCVWAAGGFNVVIYDPNVAQSIQAEEYIDQNIECYALKTGKKSAQYKTAPSLEEAVRDAWLVVECVPERIEFKTKIFGELVALTREDAILATNSSSYRSSEVLGEVPESSYYRILNVHYFMPPDCMVVELMSDGFTDPAIVEHLVERSREVGTLPYVARKESTGFIFNRLWAAVKRETLTILAEGVSTPKEIDSIWGEMFVKGGSLPCRLMDSIGLDTVALIESHYIDERGLSPKMIVDFLEREYLSLQKLGNKSANGGLYPLLKDEASATRSSPLPRILALDVGLSGDSPFSKAGEIVELAPDGRLKTLVRDQAMPDGLAVDIVSSRMLWTCMGEFGEVDGAVYSADLDGANMKTVISPGLVDTPKQLVIDQSTEMLYFCDREGLSVYRCGYDGSNLQQLVDNNRNEAGTEAKANSVSGWCVGIAVSQTLNKLFWTQKGPPKGGKGRIFSADLPPTSDRRSPVSNISCLLDNLPEPIDLEYDEGSRTLYWTDRGEVPYGNSLNRVRLSETGCVSGDHELLARHFHEAIGLKLDVFRKQIYITDLGGSIYCYSMDEQTKKVLYTNEQRAFTGVTTI